MKLTSDGHDFYEDEYSRDQINMWRLEYGFHNGPECQKCHEIFCEHCCPERMIEKCLG